MASIFVNIEQNLFECTLCHKIIKKTRNFHLKQHYERLHTVDNEVKCQICKQVIKNKYALSEHITRKHKKSIISNEIC